MYIFIINPIAGNGRAKRIFLKLAKSKLYSEIESIHFFTKYKGHAEEITKKIRSKGFNNIAAIVVIGGDGTLHEVINNVKDYRVPVSFIPGGSGNDFARGCSITEKPMAILNEVVHGEKEIPYWLGNYKMDRDKERFFVNSIGFGFDAEIAQTANKSFYKRILNIFQLGKMSYVIALIQVLIRFKPMNIEFEVDGRERIISNCWMITIANHPYYGGGMKIIPNATIQPSVFPVLIIHSISKWKVLGLFLTVFTGKHVYFKEVELIEAKKLIFTSKESITYQVDGETGICKSCLISKQSRAMHVIGTKAKVI